MILLPNHPILLLSAEFAELCKPLELLQINHFTYQKQFNDGTRISLSNKPQWISDYYNLNLYQTSLFEKKPSEYKAGFNIWIGDYDLDVYQHGRQFYNTSHSITITEPHEDACEHYLFSTSPDNQHIIHYLANNLDLLHHFILYIKDRGINIFKSAQKNKLIVQKSFELKQDISLYLNDKDQHLKMQDSKKFFLKSTPIHKYTFESGLYAGVKLTQREIACIANLLKNKTALETSQEMNISRRTVESYLENIRIKLNCDNKYDLIAKLKQYKFLTAL